MRELLLSSLGLEKAREEMVLPEVGAVQQGLPNGSGWHYTENTARGRE